MDNPFSIDGKLILVTGASSGIGKSIAVECSKAGATLIITGRDSDRLSQTFQVLSGGGHIVVSADISSDDDLQKLAEAVPKIDGVVHAAGIINPKPFQFIDRKELEKVMNTNFFGPVLLTNEILRKKKINKNSSVVFVSSVSGVLCSFFGGTSYSASKGALNGIIKGMALDLAPKKIRVNAIIPGMVDTGFFQGTSISEQDLEEDRRRYPLGRYGKPEEVAYAAIFLLSDASAWTTGTNLLVDGGFTLI